jgi:hypothetical protein
MIVILSASYIQRSFVSAGLTRLLYSFSRSLLVRLDVFKSGPKVFQKSSLVTFIIDSMSLYHLILSRLELYFYPLGLEFGAVVLLLLILPSIESYHNLSFVDPKFNYTSYY